MSVLSRQQYVGAKIDGETEFVAGNDAAFTDIYDLDVVEGRDRPARARRRSSSTSSPTSIDVGVGDPIELSFPGGKKLELEVVGLVEARPR